MLGDKCKKILCRKLAWCRLGFNEGRIQKFLPSIINNYDFAELLSELLGELNASHTGSGYRAQYSDEIRDQSGVLGAFYDENYSANGLKIVEIIEKSPLDKPNSKFLSGMIIEKIDGVDIVSSIEPSILLNRKIGKPVLLSMFDPIKIKDSRK